MLENISTKGKDMNSFIKSVIDWMMQKEEELAKECAIPLSEIEQQIQKVQEEKEKLQEQHEQRMAELDDILKRLEKIKNAEVLRCNK